MKKTYKFNYIITIHNKDNLIVNVLENLRRTLKHESHIYAIIDGCTDNTEKFIDEYVNKTQIPLTKVITPDVHEIKAKNAGLSRADQTGLGFNILLQDDVLLTEPDMQDHIITIYERFGYETIGSLAFRIGVAVIADTSTEMITECDVVESIYGMGITKDPLLPGYISQKMIGVGSPECISFYAFNVVGLMDEALSPCSYDNHDFSLRCLQKNLKNYVYALPNFSDVSWGSSRSGSTMSGMRFAAQMLRNRKLLYKKHHKFIKKLPLNSIDTTVVNVVKYTPAQISLAYATHKKMRFKSSILCRAFVHFVNFFKKWL